MSSMSMGMRMFLILEQMLDKADELEDQRMIPIVYQSPLSKVEGQAGAHALRDFAHSFEFHRGELPWYGDNPDYIEFEKLCRECKRHKQHIKWLK